MKRFRIMAVITAFMAMVAFTTMTGFAATSNPSSGSTGYQIVPLYIPGAITATATPIKFKAPWPARVVHISARAGVIDTSSTNETYTVNVQQGTTSLVSSAITISAADTIYDGSLTANPDIPDEATVSVILTLGGTTPSISDVTVFLAIKRK